MSTPAASPLAGLYRLCLVSTHQGMMGSATFNTSLLVNPSQSTVTGVVHITQSVPPPYGNITVQVTGYVHEMGFGPQPAVKVISLSGHYAVSVPPPAIGTYLAPFNAVLVFHGNDWNTGQGNFHWGFQTDNGVATHSVPC